jgi:hypothetical protein
MARVSRMLVLVFALGVLAFVLGGCGAPGSGKVLKSALEWIADADCQAVANGPGGQAWWLYQRGGRTMTGQAGTIVINGDMFYVLAPTVDTADKQTVAPKWIRFSRQDLSNQEVLLAAKDVLVPLVAASLTQPLLVMQTMVADQTVTETGDGTAWIVTGKVAVSAQLQNLLGKVVAAQYLEAGLEAEVERAVSVVVDKKTGRPLETRIEIMDGSSVGSVGYTWMRGLWLPPDEDSVDLTEYLK